MLNFYNIYFGSNIRRRLKETYMAAKQNRRIIETLEPERQPPQKKRAPRKPPPDSLLKASARLAQAAVHDPDDLDTLWETGQRVQRALRRLETVLNRAER